MKFGIYTLVIENFMVKYRGTPDFAFEYVPISGGWGNGYVLLPPNHPFYGKHYDDIDIRAHGGLTFGEYFDSDVFLQWIEKREIDGDVTIENYEKFNNYWIIGFDTNHLGDDSYTCTKDYVMIETKYMYKQCIDDSIEKMKEYKSVFLRKEKLKLLENFTLN